MTLPARPGRVCVVGSTNLDLVVTASRFPLPGETVLGAGFAEHPGGKGLNQAVAAARCGAATTFLTAVGDDEAGADLVALMRDEGIAIDPVVAAGCATGRAIITVGPAGDNTIVVTPGANAQLEPGHIIQRRAMVEAAAVCLAQLEVDLTVVREAFSIARGVGATTVLNPAPAQALPDVLGALTDVIVPNEHEVERLGGVDALLGAGPSVVVVTQGRRGAAVHGRNATYRVPPFLVHPVDATAAGDAFCGALACCLATGYVMPDAVRVACAAGALAATVAGAVPSLPHRSAIDDLVGTINAEG